MDKIISARWNFLTREKYDLGLTTGLNYGLLLHARQNPQPQSVSHDITGSLNRHLLGFMAGCTFTYRVNSSYTLYINYAYHTNLTSLQSKVTSGFNAQLFTFGLGYNLGKQ